MPSVGAANYHFALFFSELPILSLAKYQYTSKGMVAMLRFVKKELGTFVY